MSDCTRSSMRPERKADLSRRVMLGRGIALAVAASTLPGKTARSAQSLPVPSSRSLNFRILRKGDQIGTHSINFHDDGTALRVEVAVGILVKFGPIPVYRYDHRVIEIWQGGALVSADAKTNDDGKAHFMTARLGPEGLLVEGSAGGPYVAPPGAILANHWNRAELDGPMINPQGGKLLRPIVSPGKEESVALASGRIVPARRYNLTGDAKLDLWYDHSDTWTATRFVAEDGSEILYERT